MHAQDVGNNKGSTVIEMTLLMPIILGCVFLYIMFFLFFIGNAKGMEEITNQIYAVNVTQQNDIQHGIKKQSGMITAIYENHDKWFDISISMRRNGRDVLKSIRRWQLATSKI